MMSARLPRSERGVAELTSSLRGVPGIDVDGVYELVLDSGGEKMRRPSLSNLPAGVATRLSTAVGVPGVFV